MSEAYSNFEEKHEPEVDTTADETTDEEADETEEEVDETEEIVEETIEETEETEETVEDGIVGPLFPPTYLKSLYLLVVNCLRSFMEPKPKSF